MEERGEMDENREKKRTKKIERQKGRVLGRKLKKERKERKGKEREKGDSSENNRKQKGGRGKGDEGNKD
jgi:hypothetical protein